MDTILVLFRKIPKIVRESQNFGKLSFLCYHLTRFLPIPLKLASLRLTVSTSLDNLNFSTTF